MRRVLDRALTRVRHCYEKELPGRPDLQGKLAVGFAIGGDGRVTSTTVVDDTLRHAPTVECVRGVLQGLAFPAPAGGATVFATHPYVFATSG